MLDNADNPTNDEEKPSSFFKKVNFGQPKPAVDPQEAKYKKRIIIALLLSLGILQTLYMNLAAFYPTFAEKHFPWVGDSQVGIVLAMFQVAYLICSPIIGQNLQRIGRKNSILLGYVVCIIATTGFGLISLFPENGEYDKVFFGVSIAIRFMQGIGDSLVATAAYSIVSIEFPYAREKYVGFCQTAVGVGLLAGPFIGQTIFNFADYQGTFYILAGILTISLIIAIFSLPNQINHYSTSFPNEAILEQRDERPSIQGGQPIHQIAQKHSVDLVALAKVSVRYSRQSNRMMKQVSYKVFFTNLRAMTAIVSSMFAMIFMLFYEPVLTKYLNTSFDLEPKYFGYVLAIGCFTYAFASPFVGMLCARVQRRYVTLFAFLFCSISLFMLGPSEILHFPHKLGLTLTGVGALGFSVAFLFVPLLPEIIASVSEKEGIEQSPFLSDKASGIYNCAYGIGNCLAPIIGGIIAGAKGFPFTCDVMAFSSLTFFVIYFIFAVIPGILQKRKQREDDEQALINSLVPQSMDNSVTMEFENSKAKINDTDSKVISFTPSQITNDQSNMRR